MPTAVAVVGVGLAAKGQHDQKKAQQSAARDQEQAAIESAEFLAEAGAAADKDILRAQQEAATRRRIGMAQGAEAVMPFVAPGQEAYRQSRDLALSGADIGGPLADYVRQGAMGGVNPLAFDTSGPVGDEMARQAQISVSGLTPQFLGNLQTAGEQGIAATADLANIRSRGLDALADMASTGAANRASVLVGATPQLQQLQSSSNEARLLGGVAGQQFKASAAQSLAGLAGKLTSPYGGK